MHRQAYPPLQNLPALLFGLYPPSINYGTIWGTFYPADINANTLAPVPSPLTEGAPGYAPPFVTIPSELLTKVQVCDLLLLGKKLAMLVEESLTPGTGPWLAFKILADGRQRLV